MRVTIDERSGRPELQVSSSGDWDLFERLGERLRQALKGHFTAKLDGIAERYWDLTVGDEVVTLHLEEDLGIVLFPAEGEEAESNLPLFERACQFLMEP